MDKEGESPCVAMTAVSTVIGTSLNGDEQCLDRSVKTPEVGLGALHVDHSNDDASQLDDPIKVANAPPVDTKAEAHNPKEATDKKKAFPKTLFILDLSNDTALVPI
jgi:hypothetical protein